MIIKDLGKTLEPSGRKQHRVLVECHICKKQRETRIGRVYDCFTVCKSCKTKARNFKHGLYDHPLRGVHNTMKQRCTNKNTLMFKSYGARGIEVCKEWSEFKDFYTWAINNGYRKGLSIDRIDNNGNYEPLNCQWITIQENIKKEAKLKPLDIDNMIDMYLNDKNTAVKDIAIKFNIDKSRIYQILKEKQIKIRRLKKC